MGQEQTKELSSDDLGDIVSTITDGSFELNALDMSPSFDEITQNMVDELKPLKNVATDFIVNEFFQTDDTLYRFMTQVYTTFERALTIYRKKRGLGPRELLFLYKGGNVLRIISKEFLIELPASASRDITNFYSPFFKRSDADFSIYLDPDTDNYDRNYHELTLLAYLVQVRIRNWFQAHLTRYFNFFRFNAEFQKQVLLPYVEKFNDAYPNDNDPFVDLKIGDAVAVGEKNFKYSANPDTTIRFVNDEEDWTKSVREIAMAVIQEPAPGSLFTITHNSALEFPGGSTDIRVKFNLTRTKAIFRLLRASGKTLNVGGELIDVSLPHKFDYNLSHFFEHMDENIATYHLSYPPVCELDFKSYSLDYLTSDLEYILFKVIDYPWADAKYTKRLNRLFYLYFINIFISFDNSQDKLQIMRDLKFYVFLPLSKVTRENFSASRLKNGLKGFEAKYGKKNLNIHHLIRELWHLYYKVDKDQTQIPELREMGKVLLQNVDFMISAIENVRQYCSTDGHLSMADLYSGEVHNLT